MRTQKLLFILGVSLLVVPGWASAQLPPSVGQVQPGLPNLPAPCGRLPGQFAATPPQFAVGVAGQQAPPEPMAPGITIPAGLGIKPAAGAGTPTNPAALPATAPNVARLTLDEVKQRVLANSKLLNLAARNVQSKGYATRAVQANYFPQVIGNVVYFHFNDFLGTVLTTPGRTVVGPRGTPLVNLPSLARDAAVVNE
jgi:hypothetical protein